MKKLVVAGVLGFAALMGLQQPAFSLSLLNSGAPLRTVKSSSVQAPLVLVQSSDTAVEVQQLQDEVRQLNGRIEEMSFQLLQMQETIRKAQEDNEFRFQQLEKGKKSGSLETTSPKTDDVARLIEKPQDMSGATGSATGTNTGKPAGQLGAIELDANGNPLRTTMDQNASVGDGTPATGKGAAQETASLGGESDSYQAAYGHVLSGDYALAETEFQKFLASYPSSGKAADANFWLGEAMYSQGKYNDAAKTFLNAHQNYSKSSKAPEMLLKLGMSLAQLDNKDTACATLREVTKRYPKASRAVVTKVASEQKRLAC